MTREQALEAIKVLTHYINGGEIEFRDKGEKLWLQVSSPSFDFHLCEYRINPEPELIPFDFSDAEFLIGKAIKAKDNSCINIITKVSRSRGIVLVSQSYYFEDLLKHYTFIDGAACGKIKQ